MRKPTNVYIIGTNPLSTPERLSQEVIDDSWTHYEDTGFEPKLQWLYDTIGCRVVEMVQLPGVGHLWIDEEGKLKEDPIMNIVASELYVRVRGYPDPIVGLAVLVVDPDEENANGIDTVISMISKMVVRRTVEYLKKAGGVAS